MDFSAAGRALQASSLHHDADVLYADESTGGRVWVGNQTAAEAPVSRLAARGIECVVNCTDDLPNFHEGGAARYLRFDIAMWHRHTDGTDGSVQRFVAPFFAFVDAALARGASVLVHCLAGAHRAGTAAVLLLMHKHGWDAASAIAAAKTLRPIINPIGHLPGLLHRYEQARTSVPVPAGVAEPSSLARFAGSSAIRAAHALAAKRLRLEARAERIEEEMDGLRAALVARRGARAHPKAD